FMYCTDRRWRLTPAYDLTYSDGPNGQHYLAVSGEATDVGADAVRVVAEAQHVSPPRVAALVGPILDAVGRFKEFASRYGVSRRTAAGVQLALAPGIRRIADLA
ncbi:MAG: HipA domain-containing protein, partial [Candidatus Eremiobacteraeota bacterium]|nr:HipA domain-containing protein [Candidatus Eremiobacteraeota bacterium]